MLEARYEKQFKKDLKLSRKEVELLRLVRTGTHSDLFCFL
jgi:mRNA-degrading endonuclease YafQ of YafQ-DinJ toxin-antitoxin module